MVEGWEFVRQHGDLEPRFSTAYPVDGIWRLDYQFAGLTLLLVDSADDVGLFRQLLSPLEKSRGYLFDLLVKSFIPDYELARKYLVNKYAAPWTNLIVAVLALPAEKRSAAMAAHMRNWNRLMRRYWAFGEKHLVADFAFEVALAVCAYDIDDSGFRDHPYYPRDLVDHYCTHLRHSRDGWRAEGVGAGVAIKAPPPPKKADLAKSKRKGIARWVELAADGDIDATEAVIEQVGKPRKVKDLGALTCALAENDAGMHADIKDNETLEIQLAQLCTARGLGDFEAPADPPAGPARCEALLPAGDAWLKTRGYRLVALEGDEWQAVLVRADYLDEFLTLSETLAIKALPAADIDN